MASTNEIAQIEAINKGLTELNNTISKTANGYLTLVKSIETGSKTIKDSTVTIDAVTKAKKETAKATEQLDALDKQLAGQELKLKQLEDDRMKTIIANKIAIQEKTKAVNDAVKAAGAEEGSLVRMRQRLAELTAQYDKTGQRTKAAAEEIDKLSREIGKAEAATNRHGRGVGGYADQLGKLPGPIGGVISGLKSFGETLWLLVANPIGAVIAGIVAAFAALGAVFTSTASGGKMLKEIMAETSAIFEVLRQRTLVIIDAFKALFSGRWKDAGDLFKKSVNNLGGAFKDAAGAAKELVDRQSDLNKEMTLHIANEAQEQLEMKKLIQMAKDKNLTDEQRIAMIEKAMRISREMANDEVRFAKRQFEIDTDKAALTAKNSELTGKQIREFIALSTEQKMKLIETNDAYKMMWDEIGGSDKFRPLVESYAKLNEADQKYYDENKRTMSQLSTFKKSLADEKLQEAIATLELESANEKKAINNRRVIGLISNEQYKDELLDQEIKFLNKKQDLYAKDSKEWIDIETEKQNVAIKINEDILKATEDKVKEQKTIEDDFYTEAERRIKENADFAEKTQKEQADLERESLKKKEQEEVATAAKIKQLKIDLAFAAVNAVFDMNKNKLDSELNDLDKKREKELSNKNLTEAQKAKIEADYQKKANAIKTKQAQNDKNQALFNATMNTAVEITKHLGNPIMIALIAALGAIQIGLIASKPIPKFKLGTKDAPEKGIFGEAGRELMSLRSGELMMADKATYFEGSKFKGARIFSNPETERLIKETDKRGYQMSDDRILAGLNDVKKAILQKPVAIYDTNHKQIGIGNSKHQEIYLNRLTR